MAAENSSKCTKMLPAAHFQFVWSLTPNVPPLLPPKPTQLPANHKSVNHVTHTYAWSLSLILFQTDNCSAGDVDLEFL